MSPVIRRNGEEFTVPSKYLLSILTALCIVLMLITFNADKINAGPLEGPINAFASVFMMPLQRGITTVGTKIKNTADRLSEISRLLDENERLKAKVDELTIENNKLQQDKYELIQFRELKELDDQYNFDTVAAKVVSKEPGKWYDSFIINKGEDDGLEVDMNILADGGLVGRIIKLGPDWAQVRAIISDDNNVTGTVLALKKNLNVSGSLKEYDLSGNITFSRFKDDKVARGDSVVTSSISEKYIPGVLIGYISEIENEPDNTKKGTITPAVDFEHLDIVLVVKNPKPFKQK